MSRESIEYKGFAAHPFEAGTRVKTKHDYVNDYYTEHGVIGEEEIVYYLYIAY